MKKLMLAAVTLALFIASPYVFRDAHAQQSGNTTGGGAPTGAAGGVLSGTYPNPAIASAANLGTPGTLHLNNADSLACAALPAMTGDTTHSAGSCANATSKINGTSFAGTSGNLVSFGPSNIPADSGVAVSALPVFATGSLNQSQILAIGTTPVNLIAAQGSGTVILLENLVFEMLPTGTAYAAGASLNLRYNNSVSAIGICQNTVINSTVNAICIPTPNAINTGQAASTIANQPITIFGGTAYTCSGTCGTLNYWIKYRVLTGY